MTHNLVRAIVAILVLYTQFPSAEETRPFSKEEVERYYGYLNVLLRAEEGAIYADAPELQRKLEELGFYKESTHFRKVTNLFTYDVYDSQNPNEKINLFCSNDDFWKRLKLSDERIYFSLKIICIETKFAVIGQEDAANSLVNLQREALKLKDKWPYVQVTSSLAVVLTKGGNHVAALIEWQKVIGDIRPRSSKPILNEVYLELALEWVSDSYLALQAYDETILISKKLITLTSSNSQVDKRLYPYINIIRAQQNKGNSEQANLAIAEALKIAENFQYDFDGNFQKTLLLIEALRVDEFQKSVKKSLEYKKILESLNNLDYTSSKVYDAPRSKFLLRAINSFNYAVNGYHKKAKEELSLIETIPDYFPSNQLASFYEIAAITMEEIGDYRSAYSFLKKAKLESIRSVQNTSAFIPDIIDSQNSQIEKATVALLKSQLKNQRITLESNRLRIILISLIALTLLSALVFFIYRHRENSKLANTDSLTKALTRRAIIPLLVTSISDKRRSTVIAIIDLDNFKKINDTYGHVMGDEVLAKFSNHVSAKIRKTDKFARYGGEEFLLLFDNATHIEVKGLIDSIRVSFGKLVSWNSTSDSVSVSFSCGVVEVKTAKEVSFAIKRADELLYEAKKAGRGRTHSAEI